VDKSYMVDNFSGVSTGGYMDVWEGKGTFDYQFYKDLSGSLFASFQDQDHQDAILFGGTAAYNEKVYSTGVSLKYNFWRWYTATIGYSYTRQTADDSAISQFTDNRVYVSLGAEKELFRW